MLRKKVLGGGGHSKNISQLPPLSLNNGVVSSTRRKVQNGDFTSQSQISFLPQPTNSEAKMSHNKD
jgi:hypothetical protein